MFFTWAPSTAPDKEQHQYKVSAPALQRVLYGTIVLVAHTKEDLSLDKIAEFVAITDKANGDNDEYKPHDED